MTVPAPLLDPAMAPLWDAVRGRLERHGTANRGRLRQPLLNPSAQRTLRDLVGAERATIDLAVLEQRLVDLGVGVDLRAVLDAVGHPISEAPARRRALASAARDARKAANDEAATWPEGWGTEWVQDIARRRVLAGLATDGVLRLLRDVRAVLDRLDVIDTTGAGLTSRTDLAADVLGSAHALDSGTKTEAAVTAALRFRLGEVRGRELWELAGAHSDLVSGPVLIWNLPVTGDLGPLAAAARGVAVPFHLTQLALRRSVVTVELGSDVLVVENPRVVEAAAQAGSALSVVCTNGNPSGAVRLLIDQLLASGAALRYHGDFDAAGLAMCGRMANIGLTPWRMGLGDYFEAVRAAEADGVDLPFDHRRAPPTSWDPPLQAAFNDCSRVVHEERLLSRILSTSGAP